MKFKQYIESIVAGDVESEPVKNGKILRRKKKKKKSEIEKILDKARGMSDEI